MCIRDRFLIARGRARNALGAGLGGGVRRGRPARRRALRQRGRALFEEVLEGLPAFKASAPLRWYGWGRSDRVAIRCAKASVP
eukprot:8566603-Alexandrium_andersonii.AAC.1